MNELIMDFEPLIEYNARFGRSHIDEDESQSIHLLVFIMIQAFDLDLYLNGGSR
jgi:hypothetical protein